MRRIAAINFTDVWSFMVRTDQLADDTDALEGRLATADTASQRVSAEYQALVGRLTGLRARLAAVVSSVNGRTADIARLRAEVRRVRDDVRRRAWVSVAKQMRESIVEHRTWIESAKLTRDDLRARLARMRTLLAMFT